MWLPSVPVRDVGNWRTLGAFEVGADRIGDWQQGDLEDVIGQAENFGRFTFVSQVQGGQRRAQTARAGSQLKAPDRRVYNPEAMPSATGSAGLPCTQGIR